MQINPHTFCLFVGYARSGSSVVGSIIDSHPNAIIAHELNVLTKVRHGKLDRNGLFDLIITKSQQLNEKGRWSGGANGEVYRHELEGQMKSSDSVIKVIGDKKGGGSSRSLRTKPNTPLEQRQAKISRCIGRLESASQIPCKFIHVIRNPYDIIAAQKISRVKFSFSRFLQEVKTCSVMKEMYSERWLDVHHEDLLNNSREELSRLMRFLGLDEDENHLEGAVKHLDFKPVARRNAIQWGERGKRKIKRKIINQFDFFNRYEF